MFTQHADARLRCLLAIALATIFAGMADAPNLWAQAPRSGPSTYSQPRSAAPVNSSSAGRMPSAPSALPPAMSPDDRIATTILVKNALIAVNQGNLTGNFTVLRDLASPGFRQKNSAGDLAAIFQNLRQQKVDLSPIVVLEPLLAPPRTTGDGQLLIEGYFPSSPLQIVFQLGYLKAETGGWMIDAVSVGVRAAPTAGPSASASSARPLSEGLRPQTSPVMATRPIDAHRR
jgi:hypothetical protein